MNKFLLFSINNQNYGINIASIVEVITIPTISKFFPLITSVEGLINYRGQVATIFKKEKSSNYNFIILIKEENDLVGLLIDSFDAVKKTEDYLAKKFNNYNILVKDNEPIIHILDDISSFIQIN